jgi:SAM-dependent methyltransferase/glycosyltransferase involved in cell wall biosynthesis
MERPEWATVVLPAYGVADAIATVIRDLAVAAYALRPRGLHLDVLVLHGDDDVAAAAAKTAAELDLPLTTVPGPASGPGAAYLAGFQRVISEGRTDLVITLDANGRHDATQIPHLIDQLMADDLDVVIGSRWARGSGTPGLSLGRWVLGRLANLAFRVLTSTRGIADATTSFRVARLPVVRDFDFGGIPLTSHSVQTAFVAMAVARGYRVGEGAIIYRPAVGGGGGLHHNDVATFARQLLMLRGQVDLTRQRRLSIAGRAFLDEHFGAAQDLERLGTAKRFFDWVLDEFDPYLRGRLLEVGAGLGTITRRLIERYPDVTIVALEPAGNLFADLQSYAALTPRVTAYRQTLIEYEPETDDGFDAVVYLNVLEHIADDERELRLAAKVLRQGGALLLFGPALEWLYSELDYRAGHYHRYSLRQLRDRVTAAGFRIVLLRYFDVLGVFPYLLVYRLLRHDDISGSTLWGYDRIVVPLSRLIQRVVTSPPLGKNVILIAVKS